MRFLGYCTNVHAGATLEATRANLQRFAIPVKQQVFPHGPMGVGLWLSAVAARDLIDADGIPAFRDWLGEAGLLPYTFNGFPYGDFHQKVVKHDVYLPTWWEPNRLEHTLNLVRIQHELLPAGMNGTISTLPIAWAQPSDAQLRAAAKQLSALAQACAELEAEAGRRITVCLEPEPGCCLQRAQDIVAFFENYLLRAGVEERVIRRYLGVCHDVCHAAVMFEDQSAVLQAYRRAGLAVGKVQVSSAIRAPFEAMPEEQRQQALAYLGSFAEDRYLHQTNIREDGAIHFHEDLPAILKQSPRGEWRIHFHVPIYLERLGLLLSSQAEILECLAIARTWDAEPDYEVETYAWGVLPDDLKQPDLVSGIAAEMQWLKANQ